MKLRRSVRTVELTAREAGRRLALQLGAAGEQGFEIDDERSSRTRGRPLDPVGHDFGPGVIGEPTFQLLRIGVDDPVLADTMALIESPLDRAVVLQARR